MRPRVLIVAAAAALVAMYLLRTVSGPDATEGRVEQARASRPVRGAGAPAVVPASLRNVFEYADGVIPPPAPPVNAAAVAAPVAPAPAPPPPAPSPLVRLVGLLRRGGQTKAALAVAGDTIVLAPGESAAGYTVVSIDEDEGVRLRTPDGSTTVLVAAPDP